MILRRAERQRERTGSEACNVSNASPGPRIVVDYIPVEYSGTLWKARSAEVVTVVAAGSRPAAAAVVVVAVE